MVKSYFNRFRKNKGKAKAKPKAQKAPRMSFAQKVNQIIASNVENKYTRTLLYKAPVSVVKSTKATYGNPATTQTFETFTWTPGPTIFDISQNPSIQGRIGNKIKLKKWIIKGVIQPNDNFSTTPPASTGGSPQLGTAPNTLTGYVDVYFGKYTNNISPVAGAPLINFYQSGATDITPSGAQVEMLYKVNKDAYKIYYHKRFKVGTGQMNNGTTLLDGSGTFPGPNGFSMTKTFGFDVCKYICKNRVLPYDELAGTALNADVQNLTVWAIFHPAAGDPGYTPAADYNQGFVFTDNNTFYNLSCMSYAEYEDA